MSVIARLDDVIMAASCVCGLLQLSNGAAKKKKKIEKKKEAFV